MALRNLKLCDSNCIISQFYLAHLIEDKLFTVWHFVNNYGLARQPSSAPSNGRTRFDKGNAKCWIVGQGLAGPELSLPVRSDRFCAHWRTRNGQAPNVRHANTTLRYARFSKSSKSRESALLVLDGFSECPLRPSNNQFPGAAGIRFVPTL